MQVNLYDFVKNIHFIRVFFCKARNAMQYRPPNATLDSCCQTVSIVTSRWLPLSDIVHHSIEWCAGVFLSTVVFTQLRYYAMQINVLLIIMKLYIETNNLQLE